eukprot:scaffold11460_cov64-Phaeocystis_antarctica.AAC.2
MLLLVLPLSSLLLQPPQPPPNVPLPRTVQFEGPPRAPWRAARVTPLKPDRWSEHCTSVRPSASTAARTSASLIPCSVAAVAATATAAAAVAAGLSAPMSCATWSSMPCGAAAANAATTTAISQLCCCCPDISSGVAGSSASLLSPPCRCSCFAASAWTAPRASRRYCGERNGSEPSGSGCGSHAAAGATAAVGAAEVAAAVRAAVGAAVAATLVTSASRRYCGGRYRRRLSGSGSSSCCCTSVCCCTSAYCCCRASVVFCIPFASPSPAAAARVSKVTRLSVGEPSNSRNATLNAENVTYIINNNKH